MKSNKIIYTLLFASFFNTGCINDFLDLKPLDKETEAIYFKTLEHFQNAANDLHTQLYSWNTGGAGANNTFAIRFDQGTDLVTHINPELSGINTIPTTDPYFEQEYKWLRNVNVVIDKSKTYSGTDDISGPVGQAYFFRAWHHYCLLQRFGGIPLMLEVPDMNSDLVWGPRNSRYQVVKSILDDLDTAIDKLQETTVETTQNDGHVTLEAAKAFKARVCLYEGTWEKYNGIGTEDLTNGDGKKSGAGIAMPEKYPSVDEFLTMAKDLSYDVMTNPNFEMFYGVEQVTNTGNDDFYEHKSYFYLFNLEGTDSNPAGKSKADNKEAIFRVVFDPIRKTCGMLLSHVEPAKMTRKLMDMYLCRDGLPVHISGDSEKYIKLNKELENRDYRLTACQPKIGDPVWSWGIKGADYKKDIFESDATLFNYPVLTVASDESKVGTRGLKFCTELASVLESTKEAMDCMLIRLPEMYLIYAEAVCELGNGYISDEDLNISLNKVRARGGVRGLSQELINLAKSKGCEMSFMGEIRRERALELYGEGFRLSDLCRWGIAEKVLTQEKCGVYVNYEGTPTDITTLKNKAGELVYDESVWNSKILDHVIEYEDPAYTPTKPGCLIGETLSRRKFAKKNYLQPIPSDQIKMNPKLVQNPEW